MAADPTPADFERWSELASALDAPVIEPDTTDEAPPTYGPASLRRGRRMARALLRGNAPPEAIRLFVGEWARVIEQRVERLAGDIALLELLRERAAAGS